jgi:hypothetical protein
MVVEMMRAVPAAGHSIAPGSVMRSLLARSDFNVLDVLGPSYAGALLTGSGSTALFCAMEALKSRSAARKVVVPAYSCPSVAASVIKAGLEPVLCDQEPAGFRFDKDALAEKIDEDVLAVVAVHLFGTPEDVESIRELVGERNIFIVEDATQATGNRVGPADQAAGTLGDIGVLSFGRGKPLSVLSGGAILTADEELRQAVRKPWNELPAPAVLSSGIPHLVILSLYSLFFHPRLFWIPQKMPRFRVGETYFTLDFPVEKANPGVGRMLKLIWPRLDSIRQVRNLVAQEYRRGLEGCSRVVLPSDPGAGSSLLRFALIDWGLPECTRPRYTGLRGWTVTSPVSAVRMQNHWRRGS